jgi:hypothetical protein
MPEERRSTNVDLSHRISMLEANSVRVDERIQSSDKRTALLEQASLNAIERLDAMNDVHTETMATLSKMQLTLEQLNEVLTTFNKWKNTKSGIKEIGDIVIWFAKVCIVISALWGAINIKHIFPSDNHLPQNQAVQISPQQEQKSTLDKLIELEK